MSAPQRTSRRTWRTSRASGPGPGPSIRANLRPADPDAVVGPLRNERTDEEELAAVAREREVQRMLFDAGLAGICFPTEYGGQGLTPAHQRALNEELAGYEYPSRLQAPTFSPVRGGPARLRHRGAEAAPHPGHPARARRSGCSSSPSRAAAPTWPAP